MLGTPLDTNILNIRYTDKWNLVTDTSYVLSDSAEIRGDCYTQLTSHSHTLGSLIRKFMKILEFIMAFKVITKKMNELNIIVNKELLEKEA